MRLEQLYPIGNMVYEYKSFIIILAL